MKSFTFALQKLGHSSPAAASHQSCESSPSAHTSEATAVHQKDSDLRGSARLSGRHNSGFSVSSMSSVDEHDLNVSRAANSQGFDTNDAHLDSDRERNVSQTIRARHSSETNASHGRVSLSRTGSLDRSELRCDSVGDRREPGTLYDHVTCSDTPHVHNLSAINQRQGQRRPSFCSIKSPDSEQDFLNSSIDSSISHSENDKLCSSSSSYRLGHGRSMADRSHLSQGSEKDSIQYRQLFRNSQAADSSKDNIHPFRGSHSRGGINESDIADSRSFLESQANGLEGSSPSIPKQKILRLDDASMREAEPKIFPVSDLEEGELHDISGEDVTSAGENGTRKVAIQNEREEGEISSEDEQQSVNGSEAKPIDIADEEHEVHSSSGVLGESVNSNANVVDSSEADHVSLDAKPPSPPPSPSASLPASYRDIVNSQDEVSSSRVVNKTPIVYRKRNWWREEDGKSPLFGNNLANVAQNDQSVNLFPSRDAPQVDSTSSLDGQSQLASSRIFSATADSSHSPVVSSTNVRSKSLDCQGRMSLDSEELSPPAGADFPGMHIGLSQPQNKKKVCRLQIMLCISFGYVLCLIFEWDASFMKKTMPKGKYLKWELNFICF